MHILVFEPVLSGHHCHYLNFILEQACVSADRVTLITSTDIDQSADAGLHLAAVLPQIEVLAIVNPSSKGLLAKNFDYYQLLRQQVAKLEPDKLWIPYVDQLIQVWGLASTFGFKLSRSSKPPIVKGLMFRGSAAYPSESRLKAFANKLSMRAMMLAPVDRLYSLDPLVQRYLKDQHDFDVKLMPEPVEQHVHMDKLEARKKLNLPDALDKRYVISIGGQNERKGVDCLINGFVASEPSDNQYLVIAGRCNETIKQLLAELQGGSKAEQIIVRDELLSVAEIQDYLNAADFIATTYPDHIGSSSFILRAAAAKVPVIASNFGWVGWVTKEHQLGYYCDVRNTNELATTLKDALSENGSYDVAEAQFDQVADFHTIDNFKRHWAEE